MNGKSLLFLLALSAAPEASAQFVNAEALVGNNATTLDIKAGSPLVKKFGFFTRHRLTRNYAERNGYFGLTDLTYPISKHANLFVEGQFYSDASPQPKIGVDYTATKSDVSFMAAGTFWNDATLQTITSYSPHKARPLSMQLETFISGSNDGYAYSIERARIGVQKGRLFVGVGADVNQTAHQKPRYNAGFVVRYKGSK